MPDLFQDLIVSRPSPVWPAVRRAAGIAVALSLHLAGIAGLILAPFLCLEMLQPPKALTMLPLRLVAPPPSGAGGGDRRPAARIRRGGGAPPGETTRPPRPEAAKPPTRATQPAAIPLEPPRSDAAASAATAATTADAAPASVAPQPGAPPGPGLPEGTGTSPTGTLTGCDRPDCAGRGPGNGEGPPGEGDGDGPLYEWDARVTQAALIPSSRALPKYPDLARRAGLQASVILMITIERDGTVGEVQVLRGPDQRWGFDLAAIEAVKQWRYHPALLSGRPVAVYAQVMVEFSLAR